jgi:hypothetical protein
MFLSRFQNGRFVKSCDPGLKGLTFSLYSRIDSVNGPNDLNGINGPNEPNGLNQMNQTNRSNQINLIFVLLSVAYIFVIFFFADSSAVSAVAPYNAFSLLHVPLYGILTVLIVFALVPCNSFPFFRTRRLNKNDPNGINGPNGLNLLNVRNRFLIAGLISTLVALADEYHQVFIPTREGSFTDVLLDVGGIALAIFFTFRLYRMQRTYVKKWTH